MSSIFGNDRTSSSNLVTTDTQQTVTGRKTLSNTNNQISGSLINPTIFANAVVVSTANIACVANASSNIQTQINNINTVIGGLTALEQALQAIEPAPNATTVQFNNSILLADPLTSAENAIISPATLTFNTITTPSVISNTGGYDLTISSSNQAIINSADTTNINAGGDINLNANNYISLTANNEDMSLTAYNITLNAGGDINLNTTSGNVVINGSNYPPVVASPSLSAVMTIGNQASTTLNMNSNSISNITTATATTFVGALTGNATSATTAITATTATTATTAGSCSGNSATATTAGSCSGNSATATTAGSCSGNSATATTATTAGSCSGNSATATTAGSCSGNSATATTATTATTAGSCSGNSATATTAGSCSGNSATATTATTATTAGSCSGNSATATTAGSCSGNSATATTATTATNVTTTSDNTNGNYYIPFSKTTAGTSTAFFIDDVTGPLTYNPSTAILSTTGFIGGTLNGTSGVLLQYNGTTQSSITTNGVQTTLLTTQGAATYSSPTITLVTTASAPYPTTYGNSITFSGSTVAQTISAITVPVNMPVNGMYYIYITNSNTSLGAISISATGLGAGIKTTYTAAVIIPISGFALGTLTKVASSAFVWSVNLVA